MAVYGNKYKIQYKRRSGNTTTIFIQEDGYTGSTVTNLTPDVEPLEITNNGDVGNVFVPTVGSGAIIRVIATPLTLTNLFTTNPQKYKVLCYNSTGATNLFWQGFVTANIYSEDYSVTTNVPIEITCTDGMALLDDYSYKPVESGTTLYTGAVSISEVLKNVLGKLNLSFTNIITSSNLLVAAGVTNIFQNLFVNNQNYQDEQNVVMSCREVLNTIFQPLGLTLSFRGDKIYVINPINLHNSALAKSYTYTGGTETATTLGGYIDLSGTTLGYYETGQQLDIIQPYNQVKLEYDPFTYTGGEYDLNKVGNYTGGTWANMTGATPSWVGDYWLATGVTFNNNFTLGYGILGFGIKDITVNNDATPTYMLIRKLRGLQNGTYEYTFPYSSIKQDENLYLKLSIDTFINTRHYYNLLTPTQVATEFQSLAMNNFELKIGNYYWNGSTGQWTTTQIYSQNKIQIRDLTQKLEDSRVNDKWITAETYIPINEASASGIGILSGNIYLKIYTGVIVSDIVAPYISAGEEDILNIFIKNIKIELVDAAHTPIQNNGIQTVVDLSNATNRKKTPYQVKLKNGVGVYGSSKAAFSSPAITPAGNNITGLARVGSSTYYNTAKLLGQDIISQYQQSRFKLNASLDVSQYQIGIDKYLIKDNKYITGKAFYITSGTYYDQQENYAAEMLEIASSRETII